MSKRFITDIDLEIIKNLYNLKNNQTITTYSLAKKIFDGNNSLNKRIFYNNKTKFIDYRMKKLNKVGIIDISSGNGKKIYTLILNNAKIRQKKVKIEELKLKIDNSWETFVKKL